MTSLKALSLFTLFLLWYVPAGDAEAGKLIDKLRKNHLCDNDSTKLAQKRWDACSSEAPVVDVNNKVHGDVFDCDCWTKSALGGKVLNIRKVNRYDDSTVEEGEKYVAVFSPGDKNNDNCKCAVVTDLIEPWHALDNNQCLRYERRSKKTKHAIKRRRKTIYYNVCVERGPKQVGYASSCIGLCGAHCGIDDRGQEISEYNKRYASLVIHDVCQAYINSTASMASKEGRRNNCGDEGSKSGGAARDAMGGVGTIAATGLFNGHCGPKCQDMKDLGGNVCDN
ncbi:hypothetical protein [Pseudobacteriovorax antillogorgiicola]|nr:hypothetical protein [Pseudobacteriovorax antillogorgiicola]